MDPGRTGVSLRDSAQASAATVSAHVSSLLRMASSEYEVRLTWSRLKFT